MVGAHQACPLLNGQRAATGPPNGGSNGNVDMGLGGGPMGID